VTFHNLELIPNAIPQKKLLA